MNLGNLSKIVWSLLLIMPIFLKAQECYPTENIIITESTGQGTLFTTNSDTYPSFCTDFGTAAPAVNDIFVPVSPGTISYDNTNLSTAIIEERVSRTLSVLFHPDYGVTPTPTSLTSTFFRSVQYTIWRWTDDPTNALNASWTANDGNTYTTLDLQAWVLDGTLEPASVVWMNPQKTNIQTEVTLNVLSNADAGTNGSLAICEDEQITASDLFAALGGTPDAGGSWSPAPKGPGVYTYSVNSTLPCTGFATSTVTVKGQRAPNPGTDATINVCSNVTVDELFLFNSLGGTPDAGGNWSPAINGIGTYTYTVTGTRGCADASATVTLNEYVIEYAVTQPACTAKGGQVQITWPTGSTMEYSINNVDFQDSPLFTNVGDGDYTITVRRISDGCEGYSNTISIVNEVCATDDSYTTDPLNEVCGNILKNDTDGQNYPLEVLNSTGLDAKGQNFSIPLDGSIVNLYDASNLFTGTISLNKDGIFCFTPDSGYSGNVPFSYEAYDNNVSKSSDIANVFISIVALALPVELISFNATKKTDKVILEWKTANEIDNDYFEVLRSNDGANWTSIGKVNGHGQSNEELSYQMIDRNPLTGKNYYQLKQTDYNGSYSFSEIKEVNFDNRLSNTIEVYPNPSRGIVNFNLDSKIEISKINVLNVNGNVVKRISNVSDKIDISDLDNGIYILQILDDNNVIMSNQRIIKIR